MTLYSSPLSICRRISQEIFLARFWILKGRIVCSVFVSKFSQEIFCESRQAKKCKKYIATWLQGDGSGLRGGGPEQQKSGGRSAPRSFGISEPAILTAFQDHAGSQNVFRSMQKPNNFRGHSLLFFLSL